jgi:hypothetical protein
LVVARCVERRIDRMMVVVVERFEEARVGVDGAERAAGIGDGMAKVQEMVLIVIAKIE